MTRDEILALLARRRDALAWRDMNAFADVYAENGRLESPLAGIGIGRNAIVEVSQTFRAAFPDAVITEEEPIIDGDRVAIMAELTGTHQGPMLGLGPTGRAFRLSMASFLRMEGGQVVHEQRLYDFTGLLVQIGVLRAKPA